MESQQTETVSDDRRLYLPPFKRITGNMCERIPYLSTAVRARETGFGNLSRPCAHPAKHRPVSYRPFHRFQNTIQVSVLSAQSNPLTLDKPCKRAITWTDKKCRLTRSHDRIDFARGDAPSHSPVHADDVQISGTQTVAHCLLRLVVKEPDSTLESLGSVPLKVSSLNSVSNKSDDRILRPLRMPKALQESQKTLAQAHVP